VVVGLTVSALETIQLVYQHQGNHGIYDNLADGW